MSEDWAAVAADVTAALADVGFAATLQRGSTNRTSPSDPAQAVPGANVPVTLVQSEFGWGHVDGTLIQARDKLYLMDSTVAPTPADLIIMPGESEPYAIIRIVPTSPGNVAVLYEVQCRR